MSETPVLAQLREAILSLELSPGQTLSERGLEPQLGASRTPIRAALLVLQGEGLVQRDGRGWIVAPLNIDELAALTEYREVLEVAGARLAIERASDDDLDALSASLQFLSQADDPAQGIGSGTGFHRTLAGLSGNQFLVSALDGVLVRLSRTRWLEVRSAETRIRAMHEHQAIATALRERDAEGAEAAVRAHLRGTMSRLRVQLESGRQGLRAQGVNLTGGATSSKAS